MNVAISGYIQQKTDLAFYYPELKKTSNIWEIITVGYSSVIMFVYEDGYINYDSTLFSTEKQAKKHLSTMYTNILNY